ncbi:MAG: glucose-6-phosphate dehydrogenase assembly protein OpcA [Chlamydiota bacterium]
MSIPTFVSPANIETELTRIWNSLQGTNKMRACLFNLILYTNKNSRSGYIRTIAQKVIEKFPSRVILISADDAPNADYLKTGVSVLSGAKGEYDIVCDLIEIEVAGSNKARTPFLILPHILPDLPVYLVWAEDPIKNDPITFQLEKFADRIIFDSESTDNLPKFATSLLHHKETSRIDIADLNWARLESWRDLLSRTFYTEDRLQKFEESTNIEITYNAEESAFFCHTRIQSIYLQAWLSCQFDWKLKNLSQDGQNMLFTYDKGSGDILFKLVPVQHPHLEPGTIMSFTLMTKTNETFSFARNLKFPHQIAMEISTPVKCDIPIQFIFAKAESGGALVKEICHKGTSSHYLKVLNLVKGLETC